MATAHASSNGMQQHQPVPQATSSAQQLHTSSGANGQQVVAATPQQQPNRIMRYAGIVADDFR